MNVPLDNPSSAASLADRALETLPWPVVILDRDLRLRLANNAARERLDAPVLAGGVAANRGLRKSLSDACADKKIPVSIPSFEFCTDNAAMIASAGWYRLRDHGPSGLDVGATPNLTLVPNTVRTNRAKRA